MQSFFFWAPKVRTHDDVYIAIGSLCYVMIDTNNTEQCKDLEVITIRMSVARKWHFVEQTSPVWIKTTWIYEMYEWTAALIGVVSLGLGLAELPAVPWIEFQTNKHQQATHCRINYFMKSSGIMLDTIQTVDPYSWVKLVYWQHACSFQINLPDSSCLKQTTLIFKCFKNHLKRQLVAT